METTTQPTPAEQATTPTRITTVSVRVKQELDTGYLPFLRMMKKEKWKNPPFGVRDATRATFEIWMSAEVGTDMTAEQAINMLSQQGHALLNQELRAQYPDAFPRTQPNAPGSLLGLRPNAPAEAKVVEVPEEAYIIASTDIVEGPAEEY